MKTERQDIADRLHEVDLDYEDWDPSDEGPAVPEEDGSVLVWSDESRGDDDE